MSETQEYCAFLRFVTPVVITKPVIGTASNSTYSAPSGVRERQALRDSAWQVAETRPAFISNEGAVLVAGSSIALLPDWGITEELADGRLVEVVLEDAWVAISRNPDSGIYLLYDRPRYALAKIRVSVDFLLAELTESPRTVHATALRKALGHPSSSAQAISQAGRKRTPKLGYRALRKSVRCRGWNARGVQSV